MQSLWYMMIYFDSDTSNGKAVHKWYISQWWWGITMLVSPRSNNPSWCAITNTSHDNSPCCSYLWKRFIDISGSPRPLLRAITSAAVTVATYMVYMEFLIIWNKFNYYWQGGMHVVVSYIKTNLTILLCGLSSQMWLWWLHPCSLTLILEEMSADLHN